MKPLLVRYTFLLVLLVSMSGCTTVQGVRVEPHDAELQHPVSFGVGFALNPINWFAWLTDRLTNFNALPIASDERAKGFRYYLPKTIVKFDPDANGSKVTFISIPDTSEEYAVIPQSFFGDYSFTFVMGKSANGSTKNQHILTEVCFNVDSSGIPTALLQEVGDVGAKLIEQAGKIPENAAEIQTKLLAARTQKSDIEFKIAKANALLVNCRKEVPVCSDELMIEKNIKTLLAQLVDMTTTIKRLEQQQQNINNTLFDKKVSDNTTAIQPILNNETAKTDKVAYFELIMKDGGLKLRPINYFINKEKPVLKDISPLLSIEVNKVK